MDNESKVPNQIDGAVDVEEAFSGFPEVAVPRQIRKSVKWSDHFCYIFTSGTTGLPKVRNICFLSPLVPSKREKNILVLLSMFF